jgi:hypothetical protein
MASDKRLSDGDQWEQNIVDNPDSYAVFSFIPQKGMRGAPSTFKTLEKALEYSQLSLQDDPRVRTCMVYALNEFNNHAMVGAMRRDTGWKPVERVGK